MKSAISIPDKLFKQGEAFAKKAKMTRSALYSKALEDYLQKQSDEAIIAKLNEVYSKVDSRLDPDLAEHTRRMLLRTEWK